MTGRFPYQVFARDEDRRKLIRIDTIVASRASEAAAQFRREYPQYNRSRLYLIGQGISSESMTLLHEEDISSIMIWTVGRYSTNVSQVSGLN